MTYLKFIVLSYGSRQIKGNFGGIAFDPGGKLFVRTMGVMRHFSLEESYLLGSLHFYCRIGVVMAISANKYDFADWE